MDIANLPRAVALESELDVLLHLGSDIETNLGGWSMTGSDGRTYNLSRHMVTDIKRLAENRILAIIEEVKNL